MVSDIRKYRINQIKDGVLILVLMEYGLWLTKTVEVIVFDMS